MPSNRHMRRRPLTPFVSARPIVRLPWPVSHVCSPRHLKRRSCCAWSRGFDATVSVSTMVLFNELGSIVLLRNARWIVAVTAGSKLPDEAVPDEALDDAVVGVEV